MGLELYYSDGQTPLNEDEKDGLMLEFISTREELDEFEQQNIEGAMQWIFGKKFNAKDVFTEAFICNLHKRMYSNVWAWAGKYRKTDKNIGIDKHQIPIQIKVLCEDVLYWLEHDSYPPAEITVRFKHRLVSIHCFSNGNGRHSRLMADLVIEKIFGEQVFTWGAANLSNPSDQRKNYMEALKAADRGDIYPLVQFAYS